MHLIFRLFFTIAALLCAGFAHAAPTITSTTINGANSELTVTFSEAVFTTTGGGSLVPGDFTLSMAGGVATIASFDSVARTSDTEWVLAFTTAGIATGSERITVVPASSSSIYDGANNAAAATQSNNNLLLNEKVVPTLSSVSLISNNSNDTFAVHNDYVILTFTASET